jgi:hypothetical protein
VNRLIAYGLLAVALVAGYAYWQHRAEQRGADAERQRLEALSDLQREANRDRSRVAEEGYAARTVYRDKFITKTVTEIRYVTQNLAACVLTPAATSMLNNAVRCATEDRPSGCGAGD